MRELQARRLRKKRKTRVLAFIIAAVVAALAGCAWTYREKIADFWVTAFEKYCTLESSNIDQEPPKVIEDVYLPTYMLEGYKLDHQKINTFTVFAKWKHNDDYLVYTQTVISQNGSVENQNVLDNEIGEYTIKQCEDNAVFCHFYNNQYFFVWIDEYKFRLCSSQEISDEDLKK